MVLVYRRAIPKRTYTFFTFSILIHFLLVLFISTRKASTTNLFITEISYEEEAQLPEAIRPQPRVGYLIPPSNPSDMVRGVETPGMGLGEPTNQPIVDLNAKIDRSQAKIDLNRYEESDNGALAIVRISNSHGGDVKSTDEILAEKPISLAKNLPRGTGSIGGMPLGSTIGLKSETPTLKIDKKAPPPTKSEIGKQIEAKIEEKLQVEKAGTQISLAGPIAKREILKKFLPQYPDWCLQRRISGIVKVRIWVNPGGDVREGTLIEVSSGYPDLDQVVIKALKSWRFAPLPLDVVQETQWGIITFKFVCG